MPMYVPGDSNFKYTITWLLWHLFPPFLKMAVVNSNVPISLQDVGKEDYDSVQDINREEYDCEQDVDREGV